MRAVLDGSVSEERRTPPPLAITPADFRRLLTLELELFEEQFKARPTQPRKLPSEWLADFTVWRRFRQ